MNNQQEVYRDRSVFKIVVYALGIAIVFILAIVALFFILKYSASLFDKLPWAVYIYAIVMLTIPPILFGIVHYFLVRKSLRLEKKILGYISAALFCAAFLSFLVTLGRDFMYLGKGFQPDINKYWTYNFWFLLAQGLLIFLLTFLQALTGPAEEDWLTKYQKENPPA